MYATYVKNCKQADIAVVDQMCFGLLVRTVFPQCGCVTGSSLGRTVYYTGLTSKPRASVRLVARCVAPARCVRATKTVLSSFRHASLLYRTRCSCKQAAHDTPTHPSSPPRQPVPLRNGSSLPPSPQVKPPAADKVRTVSAAALQEEDDTCKERLDATQKHVQSAQQRQAEQRQQQQRAPAQQMPHFAAASESDARGAIAARVRRALQTLKVQPGQHAVCDGVPRPIAAALPAFRNEVRVRLLEVYFESVLATHFEPTQSLLADWVATVRLLLDQDRRLRHGGGQGIAPNNIPPRPLSAAAIQQQQQQKQLLQQQQLRTAAQQQQQQQQQQQSMAATAMSQPFSTASAVSAGASFAGAMPAQPQFAAQGQPQRQPQGQPQGQQRTSTDLDADAITAALLEGGGGSDIESLFGLATASSASGQPDAKVRRHGRVAAAAAWAEKRDTFITPTAHLIPPPSPVRQRPHLGGSGMSHQVTSSSAAAPGSGGAARFPGMPQFDGAFDDDNRASSAAGYGYVCWTEIYGPALFFGVWKWVGCRLASRAAVQVVCSTRLLNTSAQQRLLNTSAQHVCSTRLLNTSAQLVCSTRLLNTSAQHVCSTRLLNTSVQDGSSHCLLFRVLSHPMCNRRSASQMMAAQLAAQAAMNDPRAQQRRLSRGSQGQAQARGADAQ